MAIEKKLIHFGKLADFEAQLTAGNILDRSIVFIQDAKKIWTHGTYYDCAEGGGASGSVQSDWSVNDETSDAYVKNRTHYGSFSELDVTGISTSSEKSITIGNSTGQTIYVVYECYNVKKSLKLKANDTTTVYTLNNGPAFRIRRVVQGVAVSGHEDSGHHLYAATDVTELADFYIPDTVARTDGFKTINGESIVGNGNVELALGDDNVQSDWIVSDTNSDAFVKNRTHFATPQVQYTNMVVNSSQLNTNIFQVYTDVAFVIEGVPYDTLESVGVTLTIPGNSSPHAFTVVENNGSYFVQFTRIIGSISFNYCNRASVNTLPDAFISDAIARTSQIDELASVAKTGNYNDLSNKPTIPSAVTESTVSGWGFTKNTGTYSKPSGGIPKSDLASAVQTSLGKADTALQSYTEQYKGTVTGVKVNGTTKNPSSGVVDLGTVITSHQDISGKQDKLVSGTNIKTINGESILGSGNITISGGGSSGGGEDIRFFTDFTVEDFIEGVEAYSIIIDDTTTLLDAVRNNKVICIPFRGLDKGYKIAYYRLSDKEGEGEINLYIERDGVKYEAFSVGAGYLEGLNLVTYATKYVHIDNLDTEVFLEVQGNTIYEFRDSLNYLCCVPAASLNVPSTIRFRASDDFTLEMYNVYWANGVVPQFDGEVLYELSLSYYYDSIAAVLTPFKQVE